MYKSMDYICKILERNFKGMFDFDTDYFISLLPSNLECITTVSILSAAKMLFGNIPQTGEYKFDDEHVVKYNTDYWYIDYLSDDIASELCDMPILVSIYYKGPVVDGKLPEDIIFPNFPLWCETFKCNKDIVTPPVKIFPYYIYPYTGCSNIEVDKDWLTKLSDVHLSHQHVGYLFDRCSSDNIMDLKSFKSSHEFARFVFGEPINESFKHDVDAIDYQCSGQRKFDVTFDFNINLDYLVDNLKTMIGMTFYFSTGCYLSVDSIDRFSVLPNNSYTEVHSGIIFASSNKPIRLFVNNVDVYVPTADFVMDKCDPYLMSKFNTEFDNTNVNAGYKCSTDEFVTHGISSIVSNDYALATTTPELTIKGDGYLILKAGTLYAAIGPETNTGMSFGRWSPSHGTELKKIVIDGVTVIAITDNACFSLGTYGKAEIPEVECINGGKLICPEMLNGRGYVLLGDESLVGSTKRTVRAQYYSDITKPKLACYNFDSYTTALHKIKELLCLDITATAFTYLCSKYDSIITDSLTKSFSYFTDKYKDVVLHHISAWDVDNDTIIDTITMCYDLPSEINDKLKEIDCKDLLWSFYSLFI